MMTNESVISIREVVSSPRTKRRKDEIRTERRRTILEAAIPLFAVNGFSQTSVSTIAAAAGVSHGTVFLYFTTKEELFAAALLEPLAEAERAFHQIPEPNGSPLAQLRSIVRHQLAFMRHQESYLRLTQYVLGQRNRFPDLAEALFAFSNQQVEFLMPIIRAGQELGELAPGDPATIAISYFCFLNGVRLVLMDDGVSFYEQVTEMAIRLFGPRTLA